MSDVQTFEPDDFILGPDMPVSAAGTMLADKVAPRLTPVMIDVTDGYFLPWDGTEGNAVGLTALDVDSTGANTGFSYYAKGSFRSSAINWPKIAGDTPRDMTEQEKQAAFAGTAISVG
ncbi:head decoration protein [Klebsiella aerogenes]|uniref:head decoration protein n=1 Tax=Klebsiella aerogenes TaxID=548 RepID=UPI0034D388DB